MINKCLKNKCFFFKHTQIKCVFRLNNYLMHNSKGSLHAKVHNWIDSFGFRLNESQTNHKYKITTNHYFFATFNFFERAKDNDLEKSKFLCFDAYGESIKVKSLLDLQAAFFENISQL